MVPYEFWRIYLDADNDSTREVICRQALEQYPKFMIMANELAALLIEQKKADSKLLGTVCQQIGSHRTTL